MVWKGDDQDNARSGRTEGEFDAAGPARGEVPPNDTRPWFPLFMLFPFIAVIDHSTAPWTNPV